MLKNVGQILRSERERLGLTLDDVEKETHIRKKNLLSIEDENWSLISSRTYIQGIITTYGRFLGLDDRKLIAYFKREYERQENIKFSKKASQEYFAPRKKRLIKLIITLIFVFFLTYFGYQLKIFFTPPKITFLTSIKDEYRERKITIKGKTEKDTVLFINKNRVFLNENNEFVYNFALAEKSNQLIFEATGANGKKTIIKKVIRRRG
ncbi:hypothetical protein A2957_02825 [Candidatus Roizmanbacteria bacterium RIFCSPLOWO2_01_FULL_38_11]|uniref:HTH cro/C1-type domain-containing protein n=1 Tax=Candidatus Roizmanbacteria bacterium RIFCSPLOWO2_01_FULL_38_11 TaxID=1802060 RepID=A0A1F7IJX2_9BACT|nr:MAG: hypothetical protein A2957_02825 [Candidatus Roizmanbacteria bacterium RIFCSPLOWO2_01_FULL_38_11]